MSGSTAQVTDHDGVMLHWTKSDKGMILAITREDDAVMIVVETRGEVNPKETKAQLTTTAGALDM